jgi:hypothetical protein
MRWSLGAEGAHLFALAAAASHCEPSASSHGGAAASHWTAQRSSHCISYFLTGRGAGFDSPRFGVATVG